MGSTQSTQLLPQPSLLPTQPVAMGSTKVRNSCFKQAHCSARLDRKVSARCTLLELELDPGGTRWGCCIWWAAGQIHV